MHKTTVRYLRIAMLVTYCISHGIATASTTCDAKASSENAPNLGPFDSPPSSCGSSCKAYTDSTLLVPAVIYCAPHSSYACLSTSTLYPNCVEVCIPLAPVQEPIAGKWHCGPTGSGGGISPLPNAIQKSTDTNGCSA